MNTFPLEGKLCLMTGGLGGIAVGVARLVLERGGRVMLADLKPEEEGEEEAKTRSAVGKAAGKEVDVGYARCDVTDRSSFESAFEKCVERFGSPPDVLINAAGIAGEQRWEKLYDINLKGTHLGVELAFKHMSTSSGAKGGVVVNLSSTAGITCIGDMYATPAYVASKHAVTALTRTFGHDFHFRRHGVRVVALAPYFVETPLLEDGFKQWTEDEEARNVIKEASVGRQFLTVEETALKLVNILGANNGSVWMIRPEQMQPFNVPDYKLPVRMGYRSDNSYPKPKLYCGVPI